jgi:hypothetical protein
MTINRLPVCIAAVALYACAAGPARADMIVLESDSPKFKKGMTLPDGEISGLASGERVRVLILPSNVTKEFNGGRDNRAPGGVRGEKSK